MIKLGLSVCLSVCHSFISLQGCVKSLIPPPSYERGDLNQVSWLRKGKSRRENEFKFLWRLGRKSSEIQQWERNIGREAFCQRLKLFFFILSFVEKCTPLLGQHALSSDTLSQVWNFSIMHLQLLQACYKNNNITSRKPKQFQN